MLISLSSKELHDLRIHVATATLKVQSGVQDSGSTSIQIDQLFLHKFEDDWVDADNSDHQHDCDSAILDAFRATIVAMPVLFLKNYREGGTMRRSSAMCLLLYAQPGLENGAYRRVGVAEMQFYVSEENIDTLKAVLRKFQEPLQDPWHHETNGDGEYIISVV
jgi:hypothetical protein